MTLTIEHTETDGTLLDGTSRGDGSAEVVKVLGWRWGRNLSMWFVPRSRTNAPKRHLINETVHALREAGFSVEVSIDATVGDRGELEQQQNDRDEARSDRLSNRADRHEALARGRDEAATQITDGIPSGQPILVGHHSQAKAERDQRRIIAHTEASIEHSEQAQSARSAAQSAAAAPKARHNPVTVANRIERLNAQIRREEREMIKFDSAGGDASSTYRVGLVESLAIARADSQYWEEVRERQIQDGTAPNYSRESVKVGDAVKVRGQWRRVVRCNTKTVSLETGYSWTDRTPWSEVQDRQSPQI